VRGEERILTAQGIHGSRRCGPEMRVSKPHAFADSGARGEIPALGEVEPGRPEERPKLDELRTGSGERGDRVCDVVARVRPPVKRRRVVDKAKVVRGLIFEPECVTVRRRALEPRVRKGVVVEK